MFLAVSPEEKESWINVLNTAITRAKNRVLDEVSTDMSSVLRTISPHLLSGFITIDISVLFPSFAPFYRKLKLFGHSVRELNIEHINCHHFLLWVEKHEYCYQALYDRNN